MIAARDLSLLRSLRTAPTEVHRSPGIRLVHCTNAHAKSGRFSDERRRWGSCLVKNKFRIVHVRAKQQFPIVEGEDVPIEKEVVCVGGGFAGLLTAYLLAKQGLKVDVYERSASPLDGSAGIDTYTQDHSVLLNPMAIEQLEAAGLDPREILTEGEGYMEIDGLTLHEGHSHRTLPTGNGLPALSASSTSLAKAFLDRIEKERLPVTVHWGIRVELVNTSRKLVVVTPQVAPGETRKVINIQYKMLIGADGAGSVVRRCLEDQVDGMEFETGNEQNHLHYSLNLPAPASSRDLPPSWATKAGIWLCPTKVPSSTTPANLHLSTLPHPCGSVRLFVSLPRRLVDAYRKKGAEALASAIMEGSPELPANWAKEIAGAIFAAKGRAPEIEGATTRGTSYHGAREVLVGDAAHSLVPSLWLSGSATALGVLALVATLQGAGDDVEEATGQLPTYSKKWVHDAFSAADVSDQVFEDPRPRPRIPQRFRRKPRHIERLAPVETTLMLLVSRVIPSLVPPPGVWRLLFSKDNFSEIYRDMRFERSLSTRAFMAVAAVCCAVFLAAKVFLTGSAMA